MSNNTATPSITMLPLVQGRGEVYPTEMAAHPVYCLSGKHFGTPSHKELSTVRTKEWPEVPIKDFNADTDILVLTGTNWSGSGLSREWIGTWFHSMREGTVTEDGMTLIQENKSDRLYWTWRVRRAPADAPRLRFAAQASSCFRREIAAEAVKELNAMFFSWHQQSSQARVQGDETPFVIRAAQAAWLLAAAQRDPIEMNAEFAFVMPTPEEVGGLIKRLEALNEQIEAMFEARQNPRISHRYTVSKEGEAVIRVFYNGNGWSDLTETEVAKAEAYVAEFISSTETATS